MATINSTVNSVVSVGARKQSGKKVASTNNTSPEKVAKRKYKKRIQTLAVDALTNGMSEDDGLENTQDAENRIRQPLQRLRRGNGRTVGGAVRAAVGGANNNDNNIGENLNNNDGIIGENRPAVDKINYVDGMNGDTLLMDGH